MPPEGQRGRRGSAAALAGLWPARGRPRNVLLHPQPLPTPGALGGLAGDALFQGTVPTAVAAAAAASSITGRAPWRPSWPHPIWQAPAARDPRPGRPATDSAQRPSLGRLALGGNQPAIRCPLPSPRRRPSLGLDQPQALNECWLPPGRGLVLGERTRAQATEDTGLCWAAREHSVALPASPRGPQGLRAQGWKARTAPGPCRWGH